MRTNGVSLALVALAAAGLCMVGGRLAAGAQDGADSKKDVATAPPAADVAPKTPAGADVKSPRSADADKADEPDTRASRGTGARKPDAAEQRRLHADLDNLLKQRADLDRRIAETRGKLGETGRGHRRFEFRTDDGPPQVFEFDGDGSFPPEARKQMEEAQKRVQDAMRNLRFDDMPSFDFKFDGSPEGFDPKKMKAFQDRMEKWSKEFSNRMQRRFNGDEAPGDKDKDKKDKPSPKKPETVDI